METVADFIFLGSKITVDSDCSHEIKRHLLLGRIAMTNLGSILKSRDITLLTNFCILKAMVFPVVMYRCESWTIKKAEPQRIDAFELWCWRNSQESSPVPPFKSISFSVLNLLYGLTTVHEYWKNHSFDYTDLCWQSVVSAF